MQTYAGIDSSSRTHLVQIIDSNGEGLQKFEIENNLAGFRELAARLGPPESATIGIELTHGPIIDFLARGNFRIYPVNPLQIRRFKDIYFVSGDKSDSIDALAIARFLSAHHERLRPLRRSSPDVENLKVYGISYDRLVQERSRIANRLHFILRQYFPLADSLFSGLTKQISAHFLLRFPTWGALASTSDEEIVAFLSAHNYRRKQYVARTLQKIHNYQHCPSEGSERALALEVAALAKMLLQLHQSIARLETEMAIIVDAHPLGKAFKSLPGCGELTAAQLLGLMGDNQARFSNAAGFQALMGTAPTNYQSGGYHRVSMRRACNKRGRCILYRFAFSSLRGAPWARSYYDSQRKRGKTHSVAVRALANKWAKIIFHIWSTGQEYQDRRQPRTEVA